MKIILIIKMLILNQRDRYNDNCSLIWINIHAKIKSSKSNLFIKRFWNYDSLVFFIFLLNFVNFEFCYKIIFANFYLQISLVQKNQEKIYIYKKESISLNTIEIRSIYIISIYKKTYINCSSKYQLIKLNLSNHKPKYSLCNL